MATCLADSIDLIHIDLPGMQITPSATHLRLTLSLSLSLSFCLALSLAQFASYLITRTLYLFEFSFAHDVENCFCRTFNSLLFGERI